MSGLCHGLLRWFGHCLPVSHSRASFALPKVRFSPLGSFTRIYPIFTPFYQNECNRLHLCERDRRSPGKTLLHCSGFQRECREK